MKLGLFHGIRPFCVGLRLVCGERRKKNEEQDEEDEENFRENGESENDASKK